jgi:hypothetical protein
MTIKEAGHILINDNLPSQTRIAKASALLHKFIHSLVHVSTRFHAVVGEIPFEGERQAPAVMVPALYNIADAVFVEQPITRQRKNQSNPGWIDYWVYDQNYVFLIELKLNWIELQNPLTTHQELCKNWEIAQKQLQGISKSDIKNLAMESEKNVLKMAMLLALSESTEKAVYCRKNDLLELHNKLLLRLQPQPNWSCVWAFEEKLQKHEYDDESFDVYPGLAVMVRVEKV